MASAVLIQANADPLACSCRAPDDVVAVRRRPTNAATASGSPDRRDDAVGQGARRTVTRIWLLPLSALMACTLTFVLWRIIERFQIHDIPNERSMHAKPLAVGAGWAVIGCVMVLWPWSSVLPAGQTALICAATLILAVVGWKDDLTSLSPLLRLAFQIGVVAICLLSLSDRPLLLGGLAPAWLDRTLTAVAWIWIINLFNFMDGIDGITGTETVFVCLGYAILAGRLAAPDMSTDLALILAGAGLGFLVWNWHPARIILGDVGSTTLGFLIGWLLLDLSFRGHLVAAAILPMYPLADATCTLMRRCLTVRQPWKPHRQHFYQRVVLSGLSPPQTVLRIACLNLLLTALAVLSLSRPWLAVICAVVATSGLLLHFASHRAAGEPPQ